MSTELGDCSDDLAGLTLSELDALRDWEGRFWGKYQVVGRVKGAAASRSEAAAADAAGKEKGA